MYITLLLKKPLTITDYVVWPLEEVTHHHNLKLRLLDAWYLLINSVISYSFGTNVVPLDSRWKCESKDIKYVEIEQYLEEILRKC